MQRSEPWFWQSAEDFGRLSLEEGDHDSPDEGVCLMEAVAWVAREPHSGHPKCVCPVLGAFGRSLNDRLDAERRQALKPLIPALIGTAGDGYGEARGWLAADWLIRTHAPAWLRLAGLDAKADGLESLQEIVDPDTLRAAQQRLDAARGASGAAAGYAAWASRGASGAAAWDAARAAAWASRGAARAAAWDAARAAAWDAAWAAAWAAAGDAAWDALRPTTLTLQDSAIELFRRMVALGAEDRIGRVVPVLPAPQEAVAG